MTLIKRWPWWCGALAVALLALLALHLGARPAAATHLCGNTGSSKGPFDLLTYEYADWRATYGRTMVLAGLNELFPDKAGFALPRLESGDRSAGSGKLVEPYEPPRLLKAIAWIESSWAQAHYDVPYGAVGSVLISHDCGYGLMQITSGMRNTSGVPNLSQSMIGGHHAFNVARGAFILGDKWNAAPEFRPIVGDRDPLIIESWYYAVWSYNGFSFKNHPLNPDYSLPRSAYRCDGTQSRSGYPYQELIFGCMSNPPVAGGQRLWSPQAVHLPNVSDPAFNLSNWDACSADKNCAGMDLPLPNPSHRDSASSSLTRTQVIGSPELSASPRSIGLAATHGDESAPVSFTISNPGSGVLAWRLSKSASWLKLSRRQGVSVGSDLGSKSFNVTVRGVATSIPAGTHSATITVKSLYPSETKTVNVTFKVFELRNGTVLADSGSRYVMRGGRKRLIPNRATFEANGFDAADVVKVPNTLAKTIPNGDPLLNALDDGNLLRGSSGAIYVMEGGSKRHVASPAVMDACGYGGAVRTVSGEVLGSIPSGSALKGPPCPRLSPPNGYLVTGTGSAVYVMRGGLKRHVPNPVTFNAKGFLSANLNWIPDSSLSAIPMGDPLLDALADGNLLRGSGAEIYVMEGGSKRHVAGPAVMDACGYSDGVVRISNGLLKGIPAAASLGGPPCPRLSPPNGTVIRGTDAAIYVMRGGLKRHVPNPATFAAEGILSGNLNRIADSSLSAIPTGDPLLDVLADGNLLKGSGGAIYAMEGGSKRHVASPAVMDACGYSGGVFRLPESLLGGVPTGPVLDEPPCPRLSPPEGYLLKGNSGSLIYTMRGGLKRHVPDPTTFCVGGFLSGNVNRIASSYLAAVPTGDPLLSVLADGYLLKGSSAPIYVMEGGVKRHVESPAVMDVCGYSGGVLRVSDGVLEGIPSGAALSGPPCPRLSPPDGTLLRGSSDSIYAMDGGTKRHVPTPQVFDGCGYLYGNLNDVPDATLGAIPDGPDVTAEDCP